MTTVTDSGEESTTGGSPCPTCGSPVFEDERFCEACGRSIAPSPEPEATRPEPPDDGPVEIEVDGVGAVSDRGHRRARNEDAVAAAAGVGWSAAVVCDGVASTGNAHLAARAAALIPPWLCWSTVRAR